MCEVIKLDKIEFVKMIARTNLHVFSRVFVLDCGIAGLVYMCQDENYLYYLNRFDCTPQKKEEFDSLNVYDVQAEMSLKINLDMFLRNRDSI